MIQRFFAWGIDQVMKIYEPRIAPRKQALFAPIRGKVVEIGPGTGPNLKYFSQEICWTGIEPNPHMHPYLQREAERLGLGVEMIQGSAMEIPMDDASADVVVGTLVLCSVPCPDTVLKEVRRVLKPGGRYYFIEHVAAHPGTWTARMQRLIKPVWCCCADGCNIDRRSWEPLERAGFERLEMERFNLEMPFVTPHLMGIATR